MKRWTFFHFINQSLTRSKVEAQNGISSRYITWKCVGTSWWRLECERTGCRQTSSGLFLYKDKINPVILHYIVFSLSLSFLEDQRESFISPSDHGSRQVLSLFSGLFFFFSFVHFTSIPLREGGRGTAILPRVGVLPRELGACNLPCLGGNAGTISPTSSNRSSPAQAASISINSLSDVIVGSENV